MREQDTQGWVSWLVSSFRCDGDGEVVARRAVILAVILVRTFPFAAFSVC